MSPRRHLPTWSLFNRHGAGNRWKRFLAKVSGWFLLAAIAIIIALQAADSGFAVHMVIVAAAALIAAVVTLRRANFARLRGFLPPLPAMDDRYDDEVIRWGVIATIFWGVVGLLVGVVIAAQLSFPLLNLPTEFTTFGRLRPLHTSAVIFAFGGNALIATSFYIVQRTCRARLALPGLARFVFWGYQLFIVLAATGYVMGVTEGREYAEPEWYVDIWLTIVWVSLSPRLRRHDLEVAASRISTSPTGSTSPSSSPWRCSTSSTTSRCRSRGWDPKSYSAFSGVSKMRWSNGGTAITPSASS